MNEIFIIKIFGAGNIGWADYRAFLTMDDALEYVENNPSVCSPENKYAPVKVTSKPIKPLSWKIKSLRIGEKA